MSTLLLASIAVAGVLVVVLIVWALGWDEPARMESLDEAHRVAVEEGHRDLSMDEAVLGDRGLTALFVGEEAGLVAVHTVGTRRNVMRLDPHLVETVTEEGPKVTLETSNFGYPEFTIVLEDESTRRRWINRLASLQ